jgi:hypothetical protein
VSSMPGVFRADRRDRGPGPLLAAEHLHLHEMLSNIGELREVTIGHRPILSTRPDSRSD